jgi:hypothetical protein
MFSFNTADPGTFAEKANTRGLGHKVLKVGEGLEIQ